MIEVEKLTKRYGEITAVDGISFSIKQAEIVGILGHNGAGKTTTLKMLTGFIEPTSGLIHVDGKQMETNRLRIQKNMGYLPENAPLYPDMTVLEYLSYVSDMWDIAESDKKNRVQTALDKTQLRPVATQLIDTLSKGYKQRVGVAQAILHQPQIFILDEPTNGLDPTQIIHMRNLIKELSQHATIIISTHILQEIEAVCDRVLIIHQGKIATDSRLADLRTSHSLCVRLDGPQEEIKQTLTGLPMVKDVTLQEQTSKCKQYRVTLKGSCDEGSPAISQIAAQKNWTLYELTQERVTLEQVFRHINEGVSHA